MTFLNPFVLIGLLAASLPVLFHLIAQKRAKHVEFTSLRFLKKLEKSAMRKVKVRQILLLIIRTLLVIAIVLAFARPAIKGYLGSFLGSSHANTSLVILIDNSASMSRSDDHGQYLKQAKESARSIAGLIEDGDDALVIPMGAIDHQSAKELAHGRKNALDAIDAVRLVDRPASLSDALEAAASALSTSRNVNKEIYILSDDQARNLGTSSVGKDSAAQSRMKDTSSTLKLFDASTRIFHVDIGQSNAAILNLAIDSLKPSTTIYEPGRPVQFDAWIRNTSSEEAHDVVLSLFYDGERVAQTTVASVLPGATVRAGLAGPIRGSGLISVQAQLEPDALPFDNQRFAVINVPLSRHLAMFAENPSDAEFVRLALEQSLAEGGPAPFSIELHKLEELRSLPSFESRVDGIMVGIGASALQSPDADELRSYIAAGHGAGIFLMPGIDLNTFNTTVAPRTGLPIIAAKNGTPNDNSHFLSFSELDLSHPFFAGMFQENVTQSLALKGIESPKFFESYSIAAPRASQLIALSNGSAFLSEIVIGTGSAMLYSVPPTLQFSDFPRKSIFLPLLRRTGAYICSVKARSDENANASYVTTSPFQAVLPEAQGVQPGSTLLVKAPGGLSERATVTADAEGKPRIAIRQAWTTGVYEVFADAEARDRIAAFAVNIESDESDLTRATPAALSMYLKARMVSPIALTELGATEKNLTAKILGSRFGVELWQSFLVAAILLALLEMLIARESRTKS